MEQKYAYTLKEETDLVTWKEGLDKEALWSFVNDFMDHKITISLQYEKDRKKKKPNKKQSIPFLKRKLQGLFNKHIRERDRNEDGTWTCISCGNTFDKIHAGHYFQIPGWGNMRYDPENVNAQCAGCNLYRNGNLILYRRGLIKKIGEDNVKALEDRAIETKKDWTEWDRTQLEILIDKYK